jgi:hypothetical protein
MECLLGQRAEVSREQWMIAFGIHFGPRTSEKPTKAIMPMSA